MFVIQWGLQMFKVKLCKEDKVKDYRIGVFSWYRKCALLWRENPESPVGLEVQSVALLCSIDFDGFKEGAAG